MKTHWTRSILFSILFIPWTQYWEQNRTHFKDTSKISLALNKDCTKVDRTSKTITAEVVYTPKNKEKGLGDRHTPLTKDKGMLFVFDPPVQAQFWMKNTYIPLQIGYFNTNSELFQLLEMPVEKDPQNPKKTYPASDLVSAALEVAPHRLSDKTIGERLCVKVNNKP